MRVPHPEHIDGKELFAHLKSNKEQIIKEKKSMPIKSEPFASNATDDDCGVSLKPIQVTKSVAGEEMELDEVVVKVVANMSMYCDSHMDVLAPDCWKKTIRENGIKGKNIIAHIHDHIHKIDAKVGTVKSIRGEMLNLKKLGVVSDIDEAQGLVMESVVKKLYNEKVYNLYKTGEVNQHSIGMQYVKMELAVNSDDDEYKAEHKVWKKHINKIINKDYVENRGYFWYVSEIKLYENSAVLFGSNEITPTLEVQKELEPLQNTPKNEEIEPLQNTQKNKKSLLYNI